MKRRCTATLSDGSRRCKLSAIKGSTVCHKHGGSAPQVRRTARERLLEAADPVAGLLIRATGEAFKAQDWRAVISAAKAILDRAGVGPSSATLTLDLAALDDDALRQVAAGRPIVEVLADALQRAQAEATEPPALHLVPEPEEPNEVIL